MASLSIIFEDMTDGSVQVKSRSTKALPEDLSKATPAELVMLETTGWVAQNYNITEGGVINFGLILPDKPKIITG